MKKRPKKNLVRFILLTIVAVLFILIFILPLVLSLFDGEKYGNVALIPVEGMLTTTGGTYLGSPTVSSKAIVKFIEEADESSQIKIIVIEINSPGGSAVASDEIGAALKKAKKPTFALIRDVGASGGYWIASATDYIIANRMSITGSIGVISSYLEFSGMMDKYGVGYERLTAGEYKDVGTPFRKLQEVEHDLLQSKIDQIHDFFIEEVAQNRGLSKSKVEEIATGEFFLGVDALKLGLIDQIGDKGTLTDYLKENYPLKHVDFVEYKRKSTLVDLFGGVFSDFSFDLGRGMGSIFLEKEDNILLV